MNETSTSSTKLTPAVQLKKKISTEFRGNSTNGLVTDNESKMHMDRGGLYKSVQFIQHTDSLISSGTSLNI